MEKKRPIYLNVLKIRLPINALASILHRVTGILLFFCIPFTLYCLDQSLQSPASFSKIQQLLLGPWSLLFWVIIVFFIYHLIAGIRHILLDLGIGESLNQALFGAYAVFGLTLILSIWVGTSLW